MLFEQLPLRQAQKSAGLLAANVVKKPDGRFVEKANSSPIDNGHVRVRADPNVTLALLLGPVDTVDGIG